MRRIPKAYIIEIQLRNAIIPVWRIVEVNRNTKLHDLHLVIQAAMGWKCAHLYRFVIDGTTYEFPYPDSHNDDEKTGSEDSRKFSLYKLEVKRGDAFRYIYDFGDNWEHDVLVRGIGYDSFRMDKGSYCSAGAMACPPEDIGGTHVYNQLLEYIIHRTPISVNPDLEEYFKDFDVYDVPAVQDYLFGKKVLWLRKKYPKI